jgi:hypothetical protein
MILGHLEDMVTMNIRMFEMGVEMMGKSLYSRALSRNIVSLRYMFAEDFLGFEE